MRKKHYMVMWTYQDRIGRMTGALEMIASSRKGAKEEFFKKNAKLVIGKDHRGNPIYNPKGGYTCEAVLTYEEWLAEGKPKEF